MENKNNNVLNRVLLLMKYDTNKTLSENSNVINGEFSELLGEQRGRIKPTAVKPKPNLGAAKSARATTINKYKLQHQTSPLTPKQRNAFGQELLKNEVSIYANTKLPNGKYPTAAQQQKYADDLVNSGKIQSTINTHAPSTKPTTATKGGTTQKNSQSTSQVVNVNVTGGGTRAARTKSGKTKKLDGSKGQKTGTSVPATFKDKILNLAKNGWSWKKIIWTAAKWGIAAYAVWWLFFSEKDAEVPDDIPQTPPEDTTPSTEKYTECPDTLPIQQYCKNETIRRLQDCLGIVADGKFGPKTQEALEAKGLDGTVITTETITAACGGGGTSTTDTTTTTTDNLTGYEDYTTDEVETSSEESTTTTATPSDDDAVEQ